ncbi:SpoIVB peptidase [Clostridium sp. D2Q-11]|uniref:SpoIVB peptidase n=2 Tax=Anaeromonas frigoriresistens TaxID=2683708 RepID=A0A942Z7W8_9FIRM|nr:SpoIVB peptidase [Anaeromonas frigoriresistens]
MSYVFLVVVFVYIIQIVNIFQLPSNINLFKGDKKNIDILFPFTLDVLQTKDKILQIENNNDQLNLMARNSYKLNTEKEGKTNIKIKLLGLVPVKTMEVNIVNRIKLYPGGHSIGVKINTDGVLIVAISKIEGKDGKTYIPSKEAGIEVGDSILEINDIKIKDSYHVIELLNNIGNNEVKLKIRRDGKEFTTNIKPIKSKEDDSYRIGLWVRDKTAGIGTLTFYHPETKKFAALGHGISDIDTGKLMSISDGEILEATISSIEQGKKGHPGELRGMFFESQNLLGKIDKNTTFGIYGKMTKEFKNPFFEEPIPIALQHEIKEGKAYILSTIDGKEIKKFDVEIVKLESQLNIESKSMVIKVTDKELLSKTGGIVQGMSGSPIIQDGKIVGAITHVFVNEPTKGYGLYIEWMLEQAELINNEIGKEKMRKSPCFFFFML